MTPSAAPADRSRLYLPLALTLILFGVYFPLSGRPLLVPGLGDVRPYLRFAAYSALIVFVVRAIDLLVFDLLASRHRNVAAPQLLRGIVSLVLYAVLLTSAFSAVFQFDLRAVLTASAVVGAVLALALQDTLGNLFAGIALHMEQTYEVGDVIRIGDFIGAVEGVSWRATRIRGYDNQIIVLPNSVIARERLEMFPRNNLNGRVISVGIDYHIAPATAIGVLTQVAAHVEGVARELPCFARVAKFGDSSVVYEIKYFTRDYSARDRIDADIRKAVWYALRRNEIAIPFPIRSYHPYSPPEASHHLGAEETLQRLRAVDILDPLSDSALQSLADSSVTHFYSKGEAILRHGASGDSMFVLHSGTVGVRLPDDTLTGWHQVAQLGPGDVFGEMALFTGEARAADVVAVTDVVAVEITKDALQPILNGHPDLARAVSHQILQRREHLETVRGESREEEELTLMSRIRSYFGL